MKKLTGTVVSVHVGDNDELEKSAQPLIQAELDGFVDDGHRGHSRVCYAGDSEPEGTVRRNDRQWSGVSTEELALIGEAMDLTEPLRPTTLGANLCIQGIEDFSSLPRGSRLIFPSGATLMVEMYNPPCAEMSEKIANLHACRSGDAPHRAAFALAARKLRGLVGVVDVRGEIAAGDEVLVTVPESF
jgi:hypothetical protein